MVPELIVCDQMDSGWSGTRRNFQSAAMVPLRGAKINVQTNTYERSEVRTKVRFILPSTLLHSKRPAPAHSFADARREQMGFLHNQGGSPMASRSWEKANNPYWSEHVETWYRGHQDAEEYCRRRKLSCATFERWARHLVSAEDLQQTGGSSAEIALGKSVKQRAKRSGVAGLRAIATVHARTAVRSLFGLSGACMLKR